MKTWQAGIIVDQKGPEESHADEDRIRKTIDLLIESENRGSQHPISSMVILRAVSTNIYCKKTLIAGQNVELRCDVVGAPIVIKSICPPGTEKEIERILSTFD